MYTYSALIKEKNWIMSHFEVVQVVQIWGRGGGRGEFGQNPKEKQFFLRRTCLTGLQRLLENQKFALDQAISYLWTLTLTCMKVGTKICLKIWIWIFFQNFAGQRRVKIIDSLLHILWDNEMERNVRDLLLPPISKAAISCVRSVSAYHLLSYLLAVYTTYFLTYLQCIPLTFT